MNASRKVKSNGFTTQPDFILGVRVEVQLVCSLNL
jgi:hypothetical protein